ncbi:ABC1 kinase family protein [Micromonospora olivasterospora]|uniref:Ubiquinone biosynthesis protein n=1 Tax=Micromonospora olivasterospora TaxID=1880 RepID=A0A562I237_MICOL|nr:AarF/UbiB family protein [Micromonospora olivasterospora]TWH65101.1 ubiquinone biosynthesis protein [Micromonospora olivasterospora]
MAGRVALAVRAAHTVVVSLGVLVPAVVSAAVLAAVRGREAGLRHVYRRSTGLLMRLGSTFVKAGQVLGTRRDLLPPAFCDELSVLQDAVAPLDDAGTRRALVEAYGTAEPDLFAELDPRPVASGSVACVYRGRLRTGEEVALKLRRPGVERLMTLDLALMRAGAAVMARLPVFRDVPVNEVMRHMSEAVLGQLDFAREAGNLRRLRADLSAVPRVWVPLVHDAASRPRCIVMEYVPDLDVDTARRCPPVLRRRFASSGLTAIYHMLFVDGFVHCDMHPGNLYFTRGGQVVVLDAGFSVQLTEQLRRLFAEFFLNMSIGRGRHCAEIVVRSGTGLRPDADVAGFLVKMADLVERSHGLPAREFSLIAFAAEMFDLQRRYGVYAAPELIFPLLSLLVIEGTVRELDPDMDFQEVARPVLMRGLFGRREAA